MAGDFKGHEDKMADAADTVPVDPADLGSVLSYAVREVNRGFSRALQIRIADYGISMGQWYFLRALWEEDGLTQRELSQRVGMMEPTTVTALNTLERFKLVQRVRNPHDRRKLNIYLTAKGRALRFEMLPCADQVAELATRGIGMADMILAIDVLRRVAGNLAGDGSLLNSAMDEDLG